MSACSTFAAEQFPEKNAIYVSDLEANFIAAQEDNCWQGYVYQFPYKIEITELHKETEDIFLSIDKNDVDATVDYLLSVLANYGMIGVVSVKYLNQTGYDLYKKYSLTPTEY
jgi:hypothetical protein